MSDPFWMFKGPFVIATLGATSLFAGTAWTVTGKAWDRYRGWVYRTKEPRRYWWNVAAYCVVGAGLIAGFWFKVHSGSN